MLTVACSGPKSFNVDSLPGAGDNDSLEVTPTPTPGPSPSPTITPSPSPTPTPVAEASPKDLTPLWEASIKNSKEWSDYVYLKLDTLGSDLLDVIPGDRTTFCPKYSSLSYSQRKMYWTFMLSAICIGAPTHPIRHGRFRSRRHTSTDCRRCSRSPPNMIR